VWSFGRISPSAGETAGIAGLAAHSTTDPCVSPGLG
jgi:hypothetical protein